MGRKDLSWHVHALRTLTCGCAGLPLRPPTRQARRAGYAQDKGFGLRERPRTSAGLVTKHSWLWEAPVGNTGGAAHRVVCGLGTAGATTGSVKLHANSQG